MPLLRSDSGSRYVVALDTGSTWVRTLIAEPGFDGSLRVAGFGETSSRGIRNGTVVNTGAAVEATRESTYAAGMMAGTSIDQVFLGVAGPGVRTIESYGTITIPNGEVDPEDVRRAIETAVANAEVPERYPDDTLLHVVPNGFVCGSLAHVEDPVGSRTSSLGVDVQIFTASTATVQNAIAIAHRAGFVVADVVLRPMAAADAILTTEEKDMGCALVDVGGGETSLAIYAHGVLRHAAAARIGAGRLTRDVAIVCRMPESEAERIKKAYGVASPGEADPSVDFESRHFGSYGVRKMDQTRLTSVLAPRATEIVEWVKEEVRAAGLGGRLVAGVVLTGGGAHLGGFGHLVEELLDLPVRIGVPQLIGDPEYRQTQYATLVGLAAYGERKTRRRTHWLA